MNQSEIKPCWYQGPMPRGITDPASKKTVEIFMMVKNCPARQLLDPTKDQNYRFACNLLQIQNTDYLQMCKSHSLYEDKYPFGSTRIVRHLPLTLIQEEQELQRPPEIKKTHTSTRWEQFAKSVTRTATLNGPDLLRAAVVGFIVGFGLIALENGFEQLSLFSAIEKLKNPNINQIINNTRYIFHYYPVEVLAFPTLASMIINSIRRIV